MSYRIEEWGHKSFRGGTKLYTPRYGTTVKQGKAEYIRKASWKYSISLAKEQGLQPKNPKTYLDKSVKVFYYHLQGPTSFTSADVTVTAYL